MLRHIVDYQLVLHTGVRFRLSEGVVLSMADLTGAAGSAGQRPAGRVSANPKDGSVLGLTNLTAFDWQADVPGAGRMAITPQKTVRLDHGVRLMIGQTAAVIEMTTLQGSVVAAPGWTLRIVSGAEAGREFPLSVGMQVLGSDSSAQICVRQGGIAAAHVALEVQGGQIVARDISAGAGLTVHGAHMPAVSLTVNDEFQAGGVTFRVVNPALLARAQAGSPLPGRNVPGYLRLGAVVAGLAIALLTLLFVSHNMNLVPVTLIMVSAVVPVTSMARLLDKYDTTGISLKTLGGTFMLGGTLGLIAALLLNIPALLLTGGVAALPIFAGFFEEPAKWIATAWRWKHPVYDKPLDGLIIGTASGFGFAMFETAGYGFTATVKGGWVLAVFVLVLRSVLSPFGHGLWTGIVCAAFWECGRDIRTAIRDPRFLKALGLAIALHGLWDCNLEGVSTTMASAAISAYVYRSRLLRRGYSG